MERVFEIQCDGRSEKVRVRLTLGAARIYRAEFGRDLIEDLATLYDRIVNRDSLLILEAVKGKDVDLKDEKALYEAFLESVDIEELTKKKVLGYEDIEQAERLIWAFAKNADSTIPGVDGWIEDLDVVIPMEQFIPALFQLWTGTYKTTITLKNE